jgi:hypothetical protein
VASEPTSSASFRSPPGIMSDQLFASFYITASGFVIGSSTVAVLHRYETLAGRLPSTLDARYVQLLIWLHRSYNNESSRSGRFSQADAAMNARTG